MQQLLEQVMPQAQVLTETPYLAEDALSILAGYDESELVGHAVEVFDRSVNRARLIRWRTVSDLEELIEFLPVL